MHMDVVTRTVLSGHLQVKCRRPRASPTRTARFLRACTVDMHIDIQFKSHLILHETLQEKGREPRLSTSIKHRPQLLPDEPLSVDTLLGKKRKSSQLRWTSATNSRPQLAVTSDHAAPLEYLFWTEAWESAPQLWAFGSTPRDETKKGRSLSRTQS